MDEAAASIRSAGGSVVVKVADASREADVIALFDEATGENDLELVVYNVGNNFAAPAHTALLLEGGELRIGPYDPSDTHFVVFLSYL
jgi:hypothetical protein